MIDYGDYVIEHGEQTQWNINTSYRFLINEALWSQYSTVFSELYSIVGRIHNVDQVFLCYV